MTKNLTQFALTISLFVFSTNVFALPNLRCVTSGLPTTSFLLNENEDHIELKVINHNGAKYAPVYSGIVTPSDIEMIKKSGEFFAKLGDHFSIKFNKNKCRIEEDKFFTCALNEESVIAGTKIEKVYFSTSESVDKIPDFEFTRSNVTLYLREGTVDYKLDMSYYNDDCQIMSKSK